MDGPPTAYLKAWVQVLRKYGFKALRSPIRSIQAYRKWSRFEEKSSFLKSIDYSAADLLKNKELMVCFSSMRNLNIETVNWFIPYFDHAFGGVYTILRFADYFSAKKGIRNRLIIYGSPEATENEVKSKICQLFPSLKSEAVIILRNTDVKSLPDADVCISTAWQSAYLALKFNRTKGKFYFLQDYESLFYPAGVDYALAEATYRFGFFGIANTPGLHQIYARDYEGVTEYFIPSVDKKVFYPLEHKPSKSTAENVFTIFFYARPESPRNAFELGISALSKIAKKYGARVKIYTAGSRWNPSDYGLESRITNLGLLPYEETADLYRKCDIGLVFMLTKHPSYLPFELMACGCPVVTNTNSATKWFLKDGENCVLTEPSIASICEKIELLMENPALRQRLISNGLRVIEKTNWDQEIEKIYKFISRVQ